MIAAVPSSQWQLVRPEVAASFRPVCMMEGRREGGREGGRGEGGREGGREG